MRRILIADDSAIFREGLKQILSAMPESVSLDEASNGAELLKKVWGSHYDMVLLDLSLPGASGLEALKQLANGKTRVPTIVMSAHSGAHYAVRAFRLGAWGYLQKESKPEELVRAIRHVLKGKRYVTSAIAERLVIHLERHEGASLHERLSDREYEVMRMLASGKMVKEIAEELCLSAKTISTYRARIMEKMNMKNNAQLTYYAIQHRLLEPLGEEREAPMT